MGCEKEDTDCTCLECDWSGIIVHLRELLEDGPTIGQRGWSVEAISRILHQSLSKRAQHCHTIRRIQATATNVEPTKTMTYFDFFDHIFLFCLFLCSLCWMLAGMSGILYLQRFH